MTLGKNKVYKSMERNHFNGSVYATLLLLCSMCAKLTYATIPAISHRDGNIQDTMYAHRIDSLDISPDGRHCVVALSKANFKSNQWDTQITLLNNEKGSMRTLIASDFQPLNPKWLPSGERIAFIKQKGQLQSLWTISKDSKSSRKVASFVKEKLIDYKWSPDGKYVAFLLQPFQNSLIKPAYNFAMNGLYLLEVNDKSAAPKRITPDSVSIDYNFNWSPDSQSITYAFTKDFKYFKIATIDIKQSKLNVITKNDNISKNPYYSPDGKWIAFTANQSIGKKRTIPDISYASSYASSSYICLASTKTLHLHCLPDTPDKGPTIIGWDKKSSNLYFYEIFHTTTAVYRVNIKENKLTPLKFNGTIFPNSIAYNKGYLAFTASNYDTPPEIYISKLNSFIPKQISHIHLKKRKNPGKTILFHWLGYSNEEVEGLLTLPSNFEKNKKVPLLVALHGGPTGVWLNDGLVTPLYLTVPICFSCLAADGIAVLRPNVHGSIGYGEKFRLSNYKKIGIADYIDIQKGVDELVQRGIVDKNRLALWGWSYGGYLTAMTLTKTKRFRAAVVGAGVVNLFSSESQSSVSYPSGFISAYLGEKFWDNRKLWQKHSPNYFIEKIATPTLVQIGEADHVVPLTQGYELFYPLKIRNIPTKLLIYKDQGHSFNSPKQLLIATTDAHTWIKRYLYQND